MKLLNLYLIMMTLGSSYLWASSDSLLDRLSKVNPLYSQEKPQDGEELLKKMTSSSLQDRLDAVCILEETSVNAAQSELLKVLPDRAKVILNSDVVENTKGASTRRLYSVSPQNGRQGPHWFVMVDSRDGSHQEPKFESHKDEFLLVRQAFHDAGVHVPQLVKGGVYQGLGEEGRGGVVILEHLGQVTFQQRILETKKNGIFSESQSDFRKNLYKKAIDQLIKIQFDVKAPNFLVGSTEENPNVHPLYRQFDQYGLYKRAQIFNQYFLKKLFIDQFSQKTSALDREVVDFVWSSVSHRLGGLFEVNVHRDYHSDNLMSPAADPKVLSSEAVVVIDFQDAARGNFLVDLVSLLEDPYVSLPDREKQELKRYYLELFQNKIREGRAPLTALTQFEEMYSWQSVQRMAAAIGVFSRLSTRDGNDHFLKHIRPALKIMQDHLVALEKMELHPSRIQMASVLLRLFDVYKLMDRTYLKP